MFSKCGPLFRFLAFAVVCACLPARADISTAERNVRAMFDLPRGVKFAESPFASFYMAYDDEGIVLYFNDDMTVFGFQEKWTIVDNGKKSEMDATVARRVMLSYLKKDWLPLDRFGSGEAIAVVVSAPDCPVCAVQEKAFETHSDKLGARIAIVPTLLARGKPGAERRFVDAVMCSADPTKAWNDAMHRKVMPAPQAPCLKSVWADAVNEMAGIISPRGIVVSTPRTIRSDGTVSKGWDAKATLPEIRKQLGVGAGK